MTQQASSLFQEALRLPEGDRADLAAKLIDSLDPTADEGVDFAWAAEIKQRVQDLETGQVKGIPWPEARRMILDDTDDSGAG